MKKNHSGMLLTGVMIVLAMASAACSGQATTDTASSDAEVVTRSIRVYESPT